MALSMDEQRALAEIERRLATDDPGLATCLTAFRRPGPGRVLGSPRARIIGSLFTVLLVAMVSLMVYAMIPFRGQGRTPSPPTAGTSSNVSTTTGGPAQDSPLASASTNGTGAASSAPPSASASASTTTGQANSAGSQADQSAVGGP